VRRGGIGARRTTRATSSGGHIEDRPVALVAADECVRRRFAGSACVVLRISTTCSSGHPATTDTTGSSSRRRASVWVSAERVKTCGHRSGSTPATAAGSSSGTCVPPTTTTTRSSPGTATSAWAYRVTTSGPGANIWQYDCDLGPNQQFRFVPPARIDGRREPEPLPVNPG
jgi:hypothetical protein